MGRVTWHRKHRPLDLVHDVDQGYGRLLIPWRGDWIGWKRGDPHPPSLVVRDGKYVREPVRGGFRLFRRFHNVTASGIA